MTPTPHASAFTAAVVIAILHCSGPALAGGAPRQAVDERPSLDEGLRLFYNGRYEAAAAFALPMCAEAPVDLNACELTTSALHFQIRRALGIPNKPKEWKACAECAPLLASFLAVTARGQGAARAILKLDPSDDRTLFLLGKLDLNFVWLQLATLGKKTGWKEYWEARRLLDDLVKRKPDMIRARVARAWIDYIVDTRMPRGTRWLLGGGDKKKGLRVVREAANTPADFFVATEAVFALWDMQVRERQLPDAVTTARRLARDFPENEDLAKFLATHDTAAQGVAQKR
jgi:hypothetical protein